MKDIKELFEEYYNKITTLFNTNNDSPKLLHRKNLLKKKEDEEFVTGVIVVAVIILILISAGYYFIVFAPAQTELNDLKQEKINQVNTLLNDDENHNKEAILAEIDRKNTVEELENLDIESMVYPILKNSILEELNEYKDKYNRVEVVTDNTADIMNIKNASSYINSLDAMTLTKVSIKTVDSVIIPLSINRKQAASGLITEGNIVDIYKTNISEGIYTSEESQENISDDSSSSMEYDESVVDTKFSTSKIVGGSHVVSILRSKDSGTIEQNLDLSESPSNRKLSQSSSLDIEEIMSSKAAGVYDESQFKVLLDDYGTRLSNYERTSRIGELDVEYIIMLEVPRDSVEELIDNMENIILVIPTYDAPSWVNL